MRPSPTRIPRRDVVLTRGDSLTLRATVVQSDHPAAQLLVLTGGLGGPTARLVIYSDSHRYGPCCDYGWGHWGGAHRAQLLWSGDGTPDAPTGSFDFFIPFGTMASLPSRCGWAMQLAWDSGLKSEILAAGIINVSGVAQEFADLFVWTTNIDEPIQTNDGEQIFT